MELNFESIRLVYDSVRLDIQKFRRTFSADGAKTHIGAQNQPTYCTLQTAAATHIYWYYRTLHTMSLANQHVNVAMMTSGGLAPCLSSSIAQLVHHWSKALSEGKISGLTLIMYIDGYKGVLTGDSFELPQDVWSKCDALNYLGGSPIGNSRVKVCARCQDGKENPFNYYTVIDSVCSCLLTLI